MMNSQTATMKHKIFSNKPPVTTKLAYKVNSSLIDIKKTLLRVATQNENVPSVSTQLEDEYDSTILNLRKQGIFCSKRGARLNTKLSNSLDESELFLNISKLKKVSFEEGTQKRHLPLSAASIVNLQSPPKQSRAEIVDPADVETKAILFQLEPDLPSKKHSQGKIGIKQKIKFVAAANQTNAESHSLCSAANQNLVQMPIVSDTKPRKMPAKRQTRLNSRKMYNPNDFSYMETLPESSIDSIVPESAFKNIVHSDPVTSVPVLKLKMNFERAEEFKKDVVLSSPDVGSIQVVVAADIEPLPQDRNKHSKPSNTTIGNQKVVTKKKASKKGTSVNLDAIEISSSPKNTKVILETKQISLPRTLLHLNKNQNLKELKTTSFRLGTEQINSAQFLIKPNQTENWNDVGSGSKEPYEISNEKENCNPIVIENGAEVSSSQKPTKKNVIRCSTKSKLKSTNKRKSIPRNHGGKQEGDKFNIPTRGKREKLNNVTRKITQENSRYDFDLPVDSTEKNTIETLPSKVNTFAAKKRTVSYKKNKLPKKRDSIDMVMRRDRCNSCESLFGDDSSRLVKRSKSKIGVSTEARYAASKKRKINHVRKSVGLKTRSEFQTKPQSSCSSPLPDLEIELKTPPRAVVIETLTDSDSLLEDDVKPIKSPPKIEVLADISLTKHSKNKSTHEESVSSIEMPANIPEQEAYHIYSLESTGKREPFFEKAVERILPITHDAYEHTTLLVSPQTTVVYEHPSLSVLPQPSVECAPPSVQEISSWIATGIPSDASDVFKRTAEAVLSGYAEIVKTYLQVLQGPVHPSLSSLHALLIEHNNHLSSYFNKEK